MSQVFKRAVHAPADVTPIELAEDVPRVRGQADYAAFTSVDTGVHDYPADVTLAGLDKTLGPRITRLFLQTDAESTLHMGAQVLADHSKSAKGRKGSDKDLQATLMVNIVKEVAEATSSHVSQRYNTCEDLLRRCSLEPDFKQRLKQELFEKNAINSSLLTVVAVD
jgi:hypothetical protein